MSIFKFRKDKSNSGNSAAGGESAQMKSRIADLRQNSSPENIQRFSDILFSYVSQGVWVPMMGKKTGDKGFMIDYRLSGGLAYGAFFTDPSEIKSKKVGFDMLITDINKLIDPVFQNDNFGGIVINPDTDGLFLEKKLLLKILLHSQYPTQTNAGSPQVDWGKGIPKYSPADLMTGEELLNFAMHTVLDHECGQNGYSFVSANDNLQVCPNLILQKDGETYFVAVKGYCAEDEPELEDSLKSQLKTLGEKYKARCCYASVGFGSVDNERFSSWLALRGDGFYAKYIGLQEIK